MIDVQKEREFIKTVENTIRDLEIKKAKIEQTKESLEVEMKSIEEIMGKLGCTPDTIGDRISELESNIIKLRDAINKEIESVQDLL